MPNSKQTLSICFLGYPASSIDPDDGREHFLEKSKDGYNLTFFTIGFGEGDFDKSAQEWLRIFNNFTENDKFHNISKIQIHAHSAGCLKASVFLKTALDYLVQNKENIDRLDKNKIWLLLMNADFILNRPLANQEHIKPFFSALNSLVGFLAGNIPSSTAQSLPPPFLEKSDLGDLLKYLASKGAIASVAITRDNGTHNKNGKTSEEIAKLKFNTPGISLHIIIAKNDGVVSSGLFEPQTSGFPFSFCINREEIEPKEPEIPILLTIVEAKKQDDGTTSTLINELSRNTPALSINTPTSQPFSAIFTADFHCPYRQL